MDTCLFVQVYKCCVHESLLNFQTRQACTWDYPMLAKHIKLSVKCYWRIHFQTEIETFFTCSHHQRSKNSTTQYKPTKHKTLRYFRKNRLGRFNTGRFRKLGWNACGLRGKVTSQSHNGFLFLISSRPITCQFTWSPQ